MALLVLLSSGVHASASATKPASVPALPPTVLQLLQEQHASVALLDLQGHAPPLTVGPLTRGLPGSAIKPLLLQYALSHGLVQPGTTAYCHRTLHVGDRFLPCTHPADRTVFTAETALADSCNTWFAQLGERFTAAQLQAAYASFGLPAPAAGTLPITERQLRTLGLSGPQFSPQELANAYAILFRDLPAGSPVSKGLLGSVAYGMAHPAALERRALLGKTGTASNPGQARTHGWFAGALPGRLLVVVYVPIGDGGTAARLAQQIFAWSLQSPASRQP